MTVAMVLATTRGPDGAPAALLPDGTTLPASGGQNDGPQAVPDTALGAVVSCAVAAGCEVVVLTRPAWAGAVRAVVADAHDTAAASEGPHGGIEVVCAADGHDEHAAAVAVLRAAATDGHGAAVLHGHLVADPVSLTPLLDGQGGTSVLAASGPSAGPHGDTVGMPPLRTLRGRVVAAGSPVHELLAPTEHARGAVSISPGAVPEAAHLLAALAAGSGRTEDRSSAATGDGSAPGDPEAAPAGPDPLAALLVAMVRGGITVTVRPPAREGVATLVTSTAAARTALDRRASVDVDQVRLQESVKREDGFFTTFFVSSWSPWLVRAARALGLRPDTVTWLSMGLGVLAAVVFAVGTTPWSAAGAVLLYLAFVLDCVDGQLARVTRRFSARGAWLDAMFDRGKEYVVYAGLAVGAVRGGDDVDVWLLAGAALALQTVRHTLDFGYAAQQAADVERLVRRDLHDPHDPGPSFWEVGHGVPAAAVSTPVAGTADEGGTGDGGPGAGPTVAASPARPGILRRVILALRRAEAVAVLKWAKRIVVLPIGERFALIGVLAVLSTPRLVFTVLLAWGALATVYTAAGRVIRSLA